MDPAKELWLKVRMIRSQIRYAEAKLQSALEWLDESIKEYEETTIQACPDAPAPQAETQSAASSSGEGDALAWDEQTR